jgi:CubicO group peptidase (beta-lactamase class C family)
VIAAPVGTETARRLDAVLAREQVSARVPTLVAGVVRDGGLTWAGVRGVPTPGEEGTLGTDRQYRVGSITKTFTAALVMQLRDEGALRLTDRLDDHVPGAPFGDRLLRDLLAHGSGIGAEPPGPWWERSPGVSYDELVARLQDARPRFSPGTRYHYSNLGYALLGQVVERLRQLTWQAALQTHLLDPLGMVRTSYHASPPAAAGRSVDPFSGVLTDEPAHDSGVMAPAGQLWSTVEDLSRWAAFLADPDAEILSPDTVAEMTVAHAGTPDGLAAGAYGLGLRLAHVGGRVYTGHTGSVPGFLAGLFVDRGARRGAVCLANGGHGLRTQGLPLDLLATLDELEPAIPAPWLPTGELPPSADGLLGLWYWGTMPFTLSYADGVLAARGLDDAEIWCTFRLAEGDGLIGASGYFAGEPMTVVRRSDGLVGHLECATFVFTRTPYDPDAGF